MGGTTGNKKLRKVSEVDHSQNTQIGFTIIEVVLVLAIAGLIMAAVFIGLPALQRSQRNKERHQDVNVVFAAVEEFQTHNSGRIPITNNDSMINFVPNYIDSECIFSEMSSAWHGDKVSYTGCTNKFTDPDGTIYSIAFVNHRITGRGDPISDSMDPHQILVVEESYCSKQGSIQVAVNNEHPHDFSVYYTEENGEIFCVDNGGKRNSEMDDIPNPA